MRRRLKPLLFVVLVGGLTAAVAWLPVRAGLEAGIGWIEGHGAIAWLAFVVGYIVAAVLLVPGSILTLGAGFVFGLPLGVVLVSAGSVLGAVGAFLVGRFLARDWVAERTAGMARMRALDSATHHEGFTIVLLARLSPLIPFNLLNYALALTGVRFRDFVLATWIGMLPATVLYVYIGSLAMSLTELGAGVDGGWATRGLLIVGFAATVALTLLITRKATRALDRHLEEEIVESQ